MSAASSDLIYPMVALFGWTFLVMLRNVQVRVAAVLRGDLSNEYFELFENGQPSATIAKTGNHFRNLFEVPLLFYIALLAVITMDQADSLFVMLGWGYVGLRVVHSLVHLTINKVMPRFLFFLASNLVLLVIWLRLATSVA